MTTINKLPSVPPLDARRFDGSFQHFCSVKRLVPDRKLLNIGGKEVYLHSLHEVVMIRRGHGNEEVTWSFLSTHAQSATADRVVKIIQSGQNFWLAIAARLRLIRSQDGTPTPLEVADRLATIYKHYLEEFDSIYVMSFDQEVQQRAAHGRR